MSIFTRSPMVRRTQRLRILPQIVASTVCLFSSSTRNIVPARTAATTPSTSICSSFNLPFFVNGLLRNAASHRPKEDAAKDRRRIITEPGSPEDLPRLETDELSNRPEEFCSFRQQ